MNLTASQIGRLGGKAGRGKAKARSSEVCRNAQRKSVEARKRNAMLRSRHVAFKKV